ncbi:L-serine ammonia-lyase [Natronospirillum operosum]|uniref:L-serine dehydratase n=1 Tax=Natronospirillum operosum TaxID=2759953 RepID=A0A4Z0WFM2_9GAMM|nr:L-serine ammonia-lyase [Natronospirillum operosum]TGG93348.1 L-serine ammonia-lyase [Natronospirillum operosum]
MNISVFDLFKVGIGPSSSHTVGPMRAALTFARALEHQGDLDRLTRLDITLHGSLSATGRGHGTDRAVLAGLAGEAPDTVDPAWMQGLLDRVRSTQTLAVLSKHNITLHPDRDLHFDDHPLPQHPNAVTLAAWAGKYCLRKQVFFSVGGGFVVTEAELAEGTEPPATPVPHHFGSAAELLHLTRDTGKSISQLMLDNECSQRPEAEVRSGLCTLWRAMRDCVEAGLKAEGTLPGGLDVRRRARRFHAELQKAGQANMISTTLGAMDWINLYALAVNEENAAGGRMVTAPTNGAAGIIPAVLMYYMNFSDAVQEEDVVPFLLTAGAVGALCKQNASISGAEVGCQGEVGSACAMAAAGLTEVLGGTPEQVENAAEIALEHNLGLTCDPIGGLVQVPCIERNAIAAVKAINATQMALRGDGEHFVSLDKVIQTMRDTGRDMLDKYKETSRGGLAVNVTEC